MGILFFGFLGCNNETSATSKYCSLYGCSYAATKLVHSHRIFIKVLSFVPKISFFNGKRLRSSLMCKCYGSCRGSLYRLLHKPGPREVLDEKRRLNMAYDVVYIHFFLFLNAQL